MNCRDLGVGGTGFVAGLAAVVVCTAVVPLIGCFPARTRVDLSFLTWTFERSSTGGGGFFMPTRNRTGALFGSRSKAVRLIELRDTVNML